MNLKQNSISVIALIIFAVIIVFSFSCSIPKKSLSKSNIFKPSKPVTDTDGNVYHTIKLGTQVWMVENLKTTRYSNGDTISTTHPADLELTNDNITKYQWNYPYKNNIRTPFGRLYTWYAVHDSRNIAPKDWHVPTETDWEILINHLGGDSVAGGKLKATTIWDAPNIGATNESCFTAYPTGFRGDIMFFDICGEHCSWWTSTEVNKNEAWNKALTYSSKSIDSYTIDKHMGFSVRCIKDE